MWNHEIPISGAISAVFAFVEGDSIVKYYIKVNGAGTVAHRFNPADDVFYVLENRQQVFWP
jgi:hypothetical protein